MPSGRIPLETAPALKELVRDYYLDIQRASDDPDRLIAWTSGMAPVEIVRAMGTIDEYRVEISTQNDLAAMKVIIESKGGEPVRRNLEKHFQRVLFLRIPVALAPANSLPRYEMKAKRWVKLTGEQGTPS